MTTRRTHLRTSRRGRRFPVRKHNMRVKKRLKGVRPLYFQQRARPTDLSRAIDAKDYIEGNIEIIQNKLSGQVGSTEAEQLKNQLQVEVGKLASVKEQIEAMSTKNKRRGYFVMGDMLP